MIKSEILQTVKEGLLKCKDERDIFYFFSLSCCF